MKKLCVFFAACVCMMMLFACSSATSTPEGTVKKAIKCLEEKDYEGYVDLMQFKNADELTKEQLSAKKTQIIAILQEKGSKEIDAKGGIKEYTLEEPRIEEDKAEIKALITYGNGDTKKQKFNLVKNDKGEWKLDAGK